MATNNTHQARPDLGQQDPKEDPRLYEELGVEEIGRYFGVDLLGDGGPDDAILIDQNESRVLHRDLGEIAATETDGITINRTKHRISPFVPIIKTPTYSENSGTHTGFAVEIEDVESQTGYRHVGNVSKDYLLLTNEEVRSLALEIALQSGMPFRESRIFWDGARFCHVIDFLEREEIEPGDEVGLSLITRSSYDKSWRYECALMGKRFICDNGVLSGEFFARVSFKHRKNRGSLQSGNQSGNVISGGQEAGVPGVQQENWKEIVRQGLSVIHRAPQDLHRFVQGLRLLKQAEMNDRRFREVWKLFPQIGDSIKGQILSRYVEHEEPTLYGLMNAGTQLFWHREKMTAADFQNNDAFSTGLLTYAFERLN